ncbi:hypothetical protein ERJ75_001362500 [Trypanosoma vivax]|uniref:EFHB C-terminal EF-hand domain-containing protein n=1 Tax=Trypanosoma vivax (strain Y486) TaxID=1055687 RepID=G0UCP8_TRYVY|nr:hypothetical protein TRVL_00338 [Trypanosoma vivax]KAH8608032.1 hypothetical protein ERJ75_001362500 [Trypanosoma vivax]CCC53608.1 conserved hypothetical protein [Trypanosoma vivax Y486]
MEKEVAAGTTLVPQCSVHENLLGGTRPRRHIAPQLVAAGLPIRLNDGTVAELTSNYCGTGRSTPEIQRLYRRHGEVGRTYRHYGRARDPPVDESIRFGLSSVPGQGARGCLHPGTGDRMMALMEEQLEHAYLSNIRRPLGCAPKALYDVPVPRSGFGVSTNRSDSVKSILYAGRDVDVLHPVDVRKDWGFDWERTGIDPTQHRFGKCDPHSEVTSRDVMCENRLKAKLLPKMVTDMKRISGSEIGRGRLPMGNYEKFAEAMEKRSVRRTCAGDGDAARELLSSWAEHPSTVRAREETRLANTTDPGREAAREWTNTTPVNTVRSKVRCIFDECGRNASCKGVKLDDDVRVPHLLYPCHYVKLGVNSSSFAGGRSLEDVRSLCRKINMGLNDKQIEEVFGLIAIDDRCGIEQFKNKAVEMGYLA